MKSLKRLFDVFFSILGLIFFSPLLLIFMLLVFVQDGHSPFYIPLRMGKNGKPFHMLKLRSMVVGADQAGVDTAATNDNRITKLGMIIRKYKIDELFQLWDVLKGNMSVVGPRPNVEAETRLYTQEEKKLLSVKPGMSDLSSIVFADLGEIVENSADTNIAYNQLVRPWKSRLGLFYIENISFMLDIKIIVLTVLGFFSRKMALKGVTHILRSLKASDDLIKVSQREERLVPTPPPGSSKIVTHR